MDIHEEIIKVLHSLLIGWHHLWGYANSQVIADVLRQGDLEFLHSGSFGKSIPVRNVRCYMVLILAMKFSQKQTHQ
jgi:hypothetical protein